MRLERQGRGPGGHTEAWRLCHESSGTRGGAVWSRGQTGPDDDPLATEWGAGLEEVAWRLGAQGGGQGSHWGKEEGAGAEMLKTLKDGPQQREGGEEASRMRCTALARGQGSGVATPQTGTPGEKEGSRALEWKAAGE